MSDPTYWLDLFTGTTWEEFLAAGASVSGFRESRWSTVKRLKVGDYLLCYVTGISRFIGLLEVKSEAFRSDDAIWQNEVFPCRLQVAPVIRLTGETSVPVMELRDRLSFFRDMKSPIGWTGHFRGSPVKWSVENGAAVHRALEETEAHPIVRPVDARKWSRRPRTITTDLGEVTIPEDEPVQPEGLGEPPTVAGAEPSAHDEVQWLLLKVGNDMGLDVWVARNDRGKEFRDRPFATLPRLRADLPLQFDHATMRTIEHIDVLWLRGHAIVAAFEIESTTSIYSGLLRMSDLVAMQPNINIPLYIVAPDDRREKVMSEVNRPTFSRLTPPLNKLCFFVAFSDLRARMAGIEAMGMLQYMKPEFIAELAESCEVE